MKVLAAVVIAPHMSASGAVNAALALSREISEFTEIDIALMAMEDSVSTLGKARLLKCKSSNILQFTCGFLPDKFRTLFFRSNIPDLIKKNKYDIVHIHNPIPTLEMKRIARTCVAKKIPYVVSTHGFVEVTSDGEAYRLDRFYEKLAWKYLLSIPLQYVCDHASSIYSLSPFEHELLTKKLGIPEEKIRIVSNGVDTRFFKRLSIDELDSIARKYNLPEKGAISAPVCIFLGNHTANKGLDVLVNAFDTIEEDFLLVVGGKKRPAIDYDALSARNNIRGKVIFTDMIADGDLPGLLQYSDIFVYPTLSDTLPLVILEAMASSLPVVSTMVGGIPYQVSEENGTLVEANNPEKFATAIKKYLNNSQLVKQSGEKSLEIVIDKFSWKNAASDAVTYYSELLSLNAASSQAPQLSTVCQQVSEKTH